MASIKECDRCKKQDRVTINFSTPVTIPLTPDDDEYGQNTYELCGTCLNQLHNWMKLDTL